MSRTLRSGNAYNDFPTAPPRPARTAPPNVTNNRDYTVNSRQIPAGLLRKKVAECQLEFLDVGPVDPEDPTDTNRDNHTILRLTFLHRLKEDDTPYAPIGTRGVILDLEGFQGLNGTNRSILMMSTFGYQGPHQTALHWKSIPMGRNKTVGDCVKIIRDTTLLPCHLDARNSTLVGCRDFTSQMIYQLNLWGFLRIPANAHDSIYTLFNYRYNLPLPSAIMNLNVTPSTVDYALFRLTYPHIVITGITYTGGIRQFLP
ncbi:hypothetical protein N7517_005101 [Penicillium concentricum]|uniref:Uncharacterized protein n=1 Tax=Penicillium concentricum TaxID=293559 RepID=A0A9W9S826_9EURO|nr:uncharacterized protein N7517_005101 [Penicillium concentricum]KAJ5373095.1 hypothetical protein N7517_005101 [Penicillium concentricum]